MAAIVYKYLSSHFNYFIRQDVTMICDDGRFLVNKFLLVSIFPIMKDLLSIENESLIISLPGTNLDKIQEFFFNVYNQCKNIPVDSFILKLTERLDVEVKEMCCDE